jgi:hypothetical protein
MSGGQIPAADVTAFVMSLGSELIVPLVVLALIVAFRRLLIARARLAQDSRASREPGVPPRHDFLDPSARAPHLRRT